MHVQGCGYNVCVGCPVASVNGSFDSTHKVLSQGMRLLGMCVEERNSEYEKN